MTTAPFNPTFARKERSAERQGGSPLRAGTENPTVLEQSALNNRRQDLVSPRLADGRLRLTREVH
jgi:hypothetical protein